MQNTKYWFYAPGFISFADDIFEELYTHKEHWFPERKMFMYGKEVTLKRKSCVFSDLQLPLKDQDAEKIKIYGMDAHDWSESKQIIKLREFLKDQLKIQFDYCLTHLYPDENAAISWHYDREALKTPIVSISLGDSRKFRLKPKNSSVHTDEYVLNHGDMFVMKVGCQQNYLHCVPKETDKKGPRINLTLRKFE